MPSKTPSEFQNFQKFPILFSEFYVYTPTLTETTVSDFYAGYSPAASGITSALMATSSSKGQALFKIFQMLDIIQFLNIDLPRNVNLFIYYFEGNIVDIMPNPFEIDEEKLGCTPKPKFEE